MNWRPIANHKWQVVDSADEHKEVWSEAEVFWDSRQIWCQVRQSHAGVWVSLPRTTRSWHDLSGRSCYGWVRKHIPVAYSLTSMMHLFQYSVTLVRLLPSSAKISADQNWCHYRRLSAKLDPIKHKLWAVRVSNPRHPRCKRGALPLS